MTKRVLDVGNCNYDHLNIRSLVESFGAEVSRAATIEDALKLLSQGQFDLVLVNRRLHLDNRDGLDLIRSMQADPQTRTVPVMLVSNLTEFQEQAQVLGAVPGFGKDQLSLAATRVLLGKYLS